MLQHCSKILHITHRKHRMNFNKTIVVAGALGALVVAVFVAILFRVAPHMALPTGMTGTTQETDATKLQASKGDPVDIVMDFYNAWLVAAKTGTMKPYEAGLTTRPVLSAALKAKLDSAKTHGATDPDPVLCQIKTPDQISSRTIYQQKDSAQVLITSKDKSQTAQAVVTLKPQDGGWYIDDISCSAGEGGPTAEFSFDHEGYLLKSVPPPLNKKYWYVIYEENGVKGQYAPLFLSKTSACQSVDGAKSVCDVATFTDAKKVHVYGQMTETGVDVTRIEFIKE